MSYEVQREEAMRRVSFTVLNEPSKAHLFRGLYCYLGFSRRDIASVLRLSPGGVGHYLNKYNIPTRSRIEGLRLAFIQGRVNRDYGRGKDHPNWRGGRTVNSEGYVSVMRPDHPRANSYGYVREHIVVWEEAHSTSLPRGWVIHHLNGIPFDNRPTNLIALPDRKHKTVLAAKARRIYELELRLQRFRREEEHLRLAMLSGQLIFNFDGDDSGRL